jgi:hypothetical protein
MSPPAEPREQLRRQFHEHADALFDRLFPQGAPQPTPSFDRLERRTVQLARDLAAWLLERRAAADPAAHPEQPPACPRCGGPARPAGPPGAPPPRRVLTTRAGDIELARAKFRCTACRVVFFPPR